MHAKGTSSFSGLVLLVFVLFFSAVPGCSQGRESTTSTQNSSQHAENDVTALATIADGDKPEKFMPGHSDPEQQGLYRVVFSRMGNSVAYVANRGGKVQVVQNRSRGREYASVGPIVFSPDGRRIAYPAQSADGKWRMAVDGREGKVYDALLPPSFSPDSRHIAYQAKDGGKWFIVVDETPNQGTIASYTDPEFSADSSLITYVEAAAANKDMRLFVSDLKFSNLSLIWSIGDLLSRTSRNGTRVAAGQVVGNKQRIIDFYFAEPNDIHEGRRYDLVDKLTLSDDGRSIAYCVLRGQERLMVLDGKEEPLPAGVVPELPVIRPDRKGVGTIFIAADRRFFLHQSFVKRRKMGKMYDEAAGLTYSKQGDYAYAARTGTNWFIVANGTEGQSFERVFEPRFAPDGKHLVYRAKKGGKRFVVVADRSGKTIRLHPAYDQVYDVTFPADGESVAYGVQDGRRLAWKVELL